MAFFGFPPKMNGNMPAGPVPPLLIFSVMMRGNWRNMPARAEKVPQFLHLNRAGPRPLGPIRGD
jgi:hypothetical protein